MTSLLDLRKLLFKILSDSILHAKWLNTLSYLENCGAKKIAGCEHPTKVREEMLKHAAEEFRHAFYLKQQIKKIYAESFVDYRMSYLLGGISSLHYLHVLDLSISRYLIDQHGLKEDILKQTAYLLVTYAIEQRAGEIYPLYQQVLKEFNSKVTVKSIILEEDQHLAEIQAELDQLPCAKQYYQAAVLIEKSHFIKWLSSLEREVLANRSTSQSLY